MNVNYKPLLAILFCTIFVSTKIVQLDFSRDLQSLQTLHLYLVQDKTSVCNIDIVSYPRLVVCAKFFLNDLNRANDALDLIETWKRSTSERSLFLEAISATMYDIDQPHLSCSILSSLPAKSSLLTLAEKAREDEDWSKLEIYLDCLNDIKLQQGFISVYTVSILHNELGRHYEASGEIERAKIAYMNSVEWYPVVWADPVVSLARITAKESGSSSAVDLLANHLAESTLPQTFFLLARELAFYQEDLGDTESAYCSYLIAQQYGKGLLEAYAPAPWKQQIDDRILEIHLRMPEVLSTPCPTR